MNEVIIGFYKQAEDMGYSPEATYAMLEQLNKVAEAAHAYVEDAAQASGNPELFKKALAADLLEKNAEGEGGGMLDSILQNPQIAGLLDSLKQGGAGGGIVGGLGGGALGLIMSLLTGSNPLTGLLAGGGLGAGAGYFGRQAYDAYKGMGQQPQHQQDDMLKTDTPTAGAQQPPVAAPAQVRGAPAPTSPLPTANQRIPIAHQRQVPPAPAPEGYGGEQGAGAGGGLNEQQWGDKLQGFQKNVIDPAQGAAPKPPTSNVQPFPYKPGGFTAAGAKPNPTAFGPQAHGFQGQAPRL